jgi:hypothetical protein
MILQKSVAIGVIALFVGLSLIPLSDATINESEQMIPIEVSVMNSDGSVGTQTMELSQGALAELMSMLEEFAHYRNWHTFRYRLTQFFNNRPTLSGLRAMLDLELLDKLPGHPIMSYGKGYSLLARYHARMMAKRIFTTWSYPDSVGATVIWGNGLYLPPTQILLLRQTGFMVGFVGLYVYIPPFVQGRASTTFFIGTALFAYGLSA